MTLVCAYHGATQDSGGSSAINEFIRPDSDVDTTNWSATPLWQKLDDNSDADYIISDSSTQVWPSYDTYDFECGLANPSGTPGPGSVQGMRLRVRLGIDQGTLPGTAGNADFTYKLKQGAVDKASNTFSTSTLATPSTRTYTLTEGEVNAISDHNDLRVFVTVNIGHATANLEAQCFWAEVEYYAR